MASTIPSESTTAPHLLSTQAQLDRSTTDTSTQRAASPLRSNSRREPKDVKGVFNYYLDPGDGSKPAPSIVGKPETYERTPKPLTHVAHDIRGTEDQYALDRQGFQIYLHESKEKGFVDDDEIKRVYYPEIEEILKDATGASKIFIFDHTIRRQAEDTRTASPKGAAALRGPVQRVHIDQSYKAGPERVKHHLPDEAERLLAGRYQIINVWRPIKTIRKDPLGVADANSVPDSDLLPVELIYPDRVGETYTVRPNEKHKWYYLREQTPGEVLLIKCFDSKTDGRARRVPHSAFVNEEFVDAEGRESIEVRALVFHPEDTE